ncbi:MAG TPA: inositol monophosphatase [Verrucomicrobiae bacterium]|nr:inositol monophosphatase [Verrucomicrobiae bacterium]
MDYKDFITSSLEEAAEIANKNFGKVVGVTKADDNNQVLTETDLEIGKLLVAKIEREYPNFNVIDEEAGVVDKKSDFTWVVDPIDGSSNFASGVPTYGIYLGLLEGGFPVAGGIMLPAQNELYVGIRGEGAFCNGTQIQVSPESNLLKALVSYQIDGHQEEPSLTEDEAVLLGKIILKTRNLRTSGSAFELAMVARGAYGGVVNKTSKIWDNVAAQAVIEAAGGKYTDFYGNEMDYSEPLTKAKQNFTYCAAAPELHNQLQEIIGAHTK